MLINADVKGLEVVAAGDLSGDVVLKQEVRDKVDVHDANRRAFNLGEGKPGRLIAKIFKFRLIYGGSAYSYAHDPDFMGVSTDIDFWQDVIDKYYRKYSGMKKWHEQLLATVKKQGYIEIPTGRFYEFKPKFKYGEWQWPETQIKNYPVQGLGADLVMLARIRARQLLKGVPNVDFVQTIHDSIVVDTPRENCYTVCMALKQAIEDVPQMCLEHFKYEFSLPLTCEVQVGPNKKEMTEWVFA
jgi:DNA polymerase-1